MFHNGCPAQESRAAKPRSGCSIGSNSKSVNKTPLAVLRTQPRAEDPVRRQIMQNKPKSAKRNSKTIPAPQPKLKGEVLLARDRVKPHLASPFTVRMDSRTIRRL